MVRNGTGITMVPGIAVAMEVEHNPGLIALPFTRPKPHRTIGLAWRPTSARADEFTLLGELVEEHAPAV